MAPAACACAEPAMATMSSTWCPTLSPGQPMLCPGWRAGPRAAVWLSPRCPCPGLQCGRPHAVLAQLCPWVCGQAVASACWSAQPCLGGRRGAQASCPGAGTAVGAQLLSARGSAGGRASARRRFASPSPAEAQSPTSRRGGSLRDLQLHFLTSLMR